MLDGISLADVAGPVADPSTKLAGKDASAWRAAFKRFLRKVNPWAGIHAVPVVVSPAPRPSKTVTLGLLKTAEAYLASFAAKKREAGTYTTQVMAKIRYAQKPRKVDLFFLLDTDDLGMTESYGIADVFRAVKAKGYKKCPPETGPALRDQYDDQPVGEYLYVLMNPVLGSGSYLEVFNVVRRSYGTYLDTNYANPERRFNLGTRWVVCGSAASV